MHIRKLSILGLGFTALSMGHKIRLIEPYIDLVCALHSTYFTSL